MRQFARSTSIAIVAAFTLALATFAASAESEFVGVWQVKDTDGKPFEITLSEGGEAKGTLEEGMKGTWKEQGDSAVINWETGWTTKITKQGDSYVKTAFKKGQEVDSTPANKSDAKKK